MPTVTISMSPEAYRIYDQIDKGSRSRVVSAALLLWQATQFYERKGDEE